MNISVWNKAAEYKRLSDEQKDELRKWNKSDAGTKVSKNYKKVHDAKRDHPSSEDGGIQHYINKL